MRRHIPPTWRHDTATFTGTGKGKADPEEQFKDAPEVDLKRTSR